MRVRPAPGRKVRDPEHGNRHLPESGADVPETTYWLRRLRAGDVVKIDVEEVQRGHPE